MSYCRWSSDSFQCDVYVYEDCAGGWTTHVAGRRSDMPPEDCIEDNYEFVSEEWFDAHRRLMGYMKTAKLKDIGLECDGETFNDPTPGECADRLHGLKSLGYNVPQYAIDSLREEEKGELVE